jgi:hypothetical protein
MATSGNDSLLGDETINLRWIVDHAVARPILLFFVQSALHTRTFAVPA